MLQSIGEVKLKKHEKEAKIIRMELETKLLNVKGLRNVFSNYITGIVKGVLRKSADDN